MKRAKKVKRTVRAECRSKKLVNGFKSDFVVDGEVRSVFAAQVLEGVYFKFSRQDGAALTTTKFALSHQAVCAMLACLRGIAMTGVKNK